MVEADINPREAKEKVRVKKKRKAVLQVTQMLLALHLNSHSLGTFRT